MSQFSGWNEHKLQQLQGSGKIRGYTQKSRRNIPQKSRKNIPANACQKRSSEKAWLGWNLLYWANDHALTLATEHKFHPERGWKFDWALPAVKIAIEYEGIFSEKSRHTTVAGYTGDVEKYNAAQALGWRVIRLTAVNYETVIEQLNAYMK